MKTKQLWKVKTTGGHPVRYLVVDDFVRVVEVVDDEDPDGFRMSDTDMGASKT